MLKWNKGYLWLRGQVNSDFRLAGGTSVNHSYFLVLPVVYLLFFSPVRQHC